ncbi:hypothetical protein FJTKL_10078 [Diaporthe vaccinii]|uniref:Uncharacterized protein n=1 Tax=Diaporthe vaccinii TaxID=105482 RepID=A0ABR4EL93_9PEZI
MQISLGHKASSTISTCDPLFTHLTTSIAASSAMAPGPQTRTVVWCPGSTEDLITLPMSILPIVGGASAVVLRLFASCAGTSF